MQVTIEQLKAAAAQAAGIAPADVEIVETPAAPPIILVVPSGDTIGDLGHQVRRPFKWGYRAVNRLAAGLYALGDR